MKFEETERMMRELHEAGVASLVAIKVDEGVSVALDGERNELVSLAVMMVHSLIEKDENPAAARLAFVASIMSPELRDMINDAQGELIYDEEDERHGI